MSVCASPQSVCGCVCVSLSHFLPVYIIYVCTVPFHDTIGALYYIICPFNIHHIIIMYIRILLEKTQVTSSMQERLKHLRKGWSTLPPVFMGHTYCNKKVIIINNWFRKKYFETFFCVNHCHDCSVLTVPVYILFA